MKIYLWTWITQYEEDEERRSKYVVQLASSLLRSNSLKTSVCPSVRPSFADFFQHALRYQNSSTLVIPSCINVETAEEGNADAELHIS